MNTRPCPVCGASCEVIDADKPGAIHYVPLEGDRIIELEAQVKLLRAACERIIQSDDAASWVADRLAEALQRAE